MKFNYDYNVPHTVTCDRCGKVGKMARYLGPKETGTYDCKGWGLYGKDAVHPDLDLCPACLPGYDRLWDDYTCLYNEWMKQSGKKET